MSKIVKVDRYGTYTGDYVFYVHYENGDIEQHVSESMTREIWQFMASAEFHFMKSKRGEYFHRFS